jgi:hypothetical protein
LDARQFRYAVVRPALAALGLWSAAAENLLCGTAAHESGGLRFLDQVTGSDTPGPAHGIFQIEPATHADVFDTFLSAARFADLRARLLSLRLPRPDMHTQLAANLAYAAGVARAIYYRDPEPLPAAVALPALGAYYKRVYNTRAGKATAADWLRAYERFAEREDA